MQETLPELNIDQLTVPQRLELISRLWDSLPESEEELPIPEWHRQELERRLKDADASIGSWRRFVGAGIV